MTFILAIQLKDSVIVAADKRSATIHPNGQMNFDQDETNKLNLWQNGIITGVGELVVIQRTGEFLEIFANSNIDQLAHCFQLSRLIRKCEHIHPQIDQTKIIYSYCNNEDVKLYSIESEADDYFIRRFEDNEISIWMYNPDISKITEKIKILYENLKPLSAFINTLDWINYYVFQISYIFFEQAKHDEFMSANHDIYFQTNKAFYIRNVENNFSNEDKLLS